MTKSLNLHVLLVCIALAVTATVFGKANTPEAEKINGAEWNVTVNKVILYADGEDNYTISDTARVNKGLKRLPHSENITIGWTIPRADGCIWLVAYDKEPILSEKVTVTEMYSIPPDGSDIQVTFKFKDAKKWETITKENIGKRLAVFVNGHLMNAPQVNTEITSGKCSVLIPADMIRDYLPHLDQEKLK